MTKINKLLERRASIFRTGMDHEQFLNEAKNLYSQQMQHNHVLASYLHLIDKQPGAIHSLSDMIYLPIELFKHHKVMTGYGKAERVFKSSGTTGRQRSKHYVRDLSVYEESYIKGFKLFYGPVENYCILGLLPSYEEESSLVTMVKGWIDKSQHPDSGFYFNDYPQLVEVLKRLEQQGQPVLLIGVSFALLELAEHYRLNLQHTIVMETGGMKGRRKELTREELHAFLIDRLGIRQVHSEYGMTELLSQAYSRGGGRFFPPPWMRVMIRDPYDPFCFLSPGKTGGINIVDLANMDSCICVETQDLGKVYPDGSFEVTGRFDSGDIRGCNLLME